MHAHGASTWTRASSDLRGAFVELLAPSRARIAETVEAGTAAQVDLTQLARLVSPAWPDRATFDVQKEESHLASLDLLRQPRGQDRVAAQEPAQAITGWPVSRMIGAAELALGSPPGTWSTPAAPEVGDHLAPRGRRARQVRRRGPPVRRPPPSHRWSCPAASEVRLAIVWGTPPDRRTGPSAPSGPGHRGPPKPGPWGRAASRPRSPARRSRRRHPWPRRRQPPTAWPITDGWLDHTVGRDQQRPAAQRPADSPAASVRRDPAGRARARQSPDQQQRRRRGRRRAPAASARLPTPGSRAQVRLEPRRSRPARAAAASRAAASADTPPSAPITPDGGQRRHRRPEHHQVIAVEVAGHAEERRRREQPGAPQEERLRAPVAMERRRCRPGRPAAHQHARPAPAAAASSPAPPSCWLSRRSGPGVPFSPTPPGPPPDRRPPSDHRQRVYRRLHVGATVGRLFGSATLPPGAAVVEAGRGRPGYRRRSGRRAAREPIQRRAAAEQPLEAVVAERQADRRVVLGRADVRPLIRPGSDPPPPARRTTPPACTSAGQRQVPDPDQPRARRRHQVEQVERRHDQIRLQHLDLEAEPDHRRRAAASAGCRARPPGTPPRPPAAGSAPAARRSCCCG